MFIKVALRQKFYISKTFEVLSKMEHTLTTLKELRPGEQAEIVRLNVTGVMRRRLLDLGFIPGSTVTCIRRSPLGDPIAYLVSNTMIALRESESTNIIGKKIEVTQ